MRIACTKDNPSDGEPYKWYHPDAEPTGKSFDAFYSDEESWDEYKCPNCLIVFKETIGK